MEERSRILVGYPATDPIPSYWQNPKSSLANAIKLQSDISSLDNPYDYAIIGSGISGTLVAYNLLQSKPNSRIVMLEAREVCSGATGRNGGHTKAASYRTYLQHKQELGKEEALKIVRLEYENILATHRLARDLQIECDSKLCNTVDLIYDERTFELGKAAIAALQADAGSYERAAGGFAWYKTYSAEEAASEFHVGIVNENEAVGKREQLVGAFEYLAGRINAYCFTTAILEECVKKGLDLCTNTCVHDIIPVENKTPHEISMYDIYTDNYNPTIQTVRTRCAIFATNGYTPYILSSLQSAIVPLRGQVTAQAPGSSSKLPTPLPRTYSFIYKGGYEYMIPRPLKEGGQHIIIGGGLGREPMGGVAEYGNIDDRSLNPNISKYLKGSLVGYFGPENWGEEPNQEDKRIVQEWTGIMGATADGRPFVGAVPGMQGVWISAGFNGHGMVLCLKSAEALVGMMEEVEAAELDWFPMSFRITEERVKGAKFVGRKDMEVNPIRADDMGFV